MCVIYFLNLKKSQASQDLITIYDHTDGFSTTAFYKLNEGKGL